VTTALCEGHTETGEACDATCDPHLKEVRRRIAMQDAVSDLAYRLHKNGAITEEEAMQLYDISEELWDDAIHIASPLDGHVSLCGARGRNLAPLAGERPDGLSGCWTCLQTADRLSTAEAA
jgi:hypothetical protein